MLYPLCTNIIGRRKAAILAHWCVCVLFGVFLQWAFNFVAQVANASQIYTHECANMVAILLGHMFSTKHVRYGWLFKLNTGGGEVLLYFFQQKHGCLNTATQNSKITLCRLWGISILCTICWMILKEHDPQKLFQYYFAHIKQPNYNHEMNFANSATCSALFWVFKATVTLLYRLHTWVRIPAASTLIYFLNLMYRYPQSWKGLSR